MANPRFYRLIQSYIQVLEFDYHLLLNYRRRVLTHSTKVERSHYETWIDQDRSPYDQNVEDSLEVASLMKEKMIYYFDIHSHDRAIKKQIINDITVGCVQIRHSPGLSRSIFRIHIAKKNLNRMFKGIDSCLVKQRIQHFAGGWIKNLSAISMKGNGKGRKEGKKLKKVVKGNCFLLG